MNLKLESRIPSILHVTGALALASRLRPTRHGLILTFHRILPKPTHQRECNQQLEISTRAFEDLLMYLCNHFDVVSLDRLLSDSTSTSKPRRVAITFDDGWLDTYEHAFPVLLRLGVPATVFICSALMDTHALLPEQRLQYIHGATENDSSSFYEHLSAWGGTRFHNVSTNWRALTSTFSLATKLDLLSHLEAIYAIDHTSSRHLLNWTEVKMMAESGIQFGSHTANHVILSAENGPVIQRELRESMAAISEAVGVTPRYLSYPDGAWNCRVAELVKKAGFTHAFTSKQGSWAAVGDNMSIPRIEVDRRFLVGADGRFHPARTQLQLSPLSNLFTTVEA